MIKGQSVYVTPAMTPHVKHEGVIMRKAKRGYRVRYNAWGAWFTDTFSDASITPR